MNYVMKSGKKVQKENSEVMMLCWKMRRGQYGHTLLLHAVCILLLFMKSQGKIKSY